MVGIYKQHFLKVAPPVHPLDQPLNHQQVHLMVLLQDHHLLIRLQVQQMVLLHDHHLLLCQLLAFHSVIRLMELLLFTLPLEFVQLIRASEVPSMLNYQQINSLYQMF